MSADAGSTPPKPPTAFTVAANQSVVLSFDDQGDLDRATTGRIAQLESGPITMGDHVVYDLARHAFVGESEAPPDSVHPGLWRQARLNSNHGLFEVADGIWQVRGYDLANITFLAGGDGGWMVIDPLTNAPTAAAALDLANRTLGERPVTSVIYTHSHVDHFGGILGVTDQDAVDRGDVRIVAPVGFLDAVVGELVVAGHIMLRRAVYQFGTLLPTGPRGHVDCGLGSDLGLAPWALVAPTDTVVETGQEMTLSGIRVVFQNTPDAEAPAEMNFHFPDRRVLCMAENCTHTLHNLYPIRGAQTRDALAWSKYIQEAIDLWAHDTDVMFASHHWPRFGTGDVHGFLTMQRDVYRWIHDQTMRLANQGYGPDEVAAELRLPDEFDQSHVRGYYGAVSHNCRAVYSRYLGWYDGNPAHLDPLPPVQASANYVSFMGGADAVLEKARSSFERGEYRWVVQVVNHVVFADPANQSARGLQADALEQLGYQSESATWRNAYLTGAMELRDGVPQLGPVPVSPMAGAMGVEHLFDLVGVRFDPSRFTAGPLLFNFHFIDLDEDHVLGVGRSVIHHRAGAVDKEAVASIRIDRATFSAALSDPAALQGAEILGDRDIVREFFAGLTIFGTATLIEPRPGGQPQHES